ncbi:MAG: dihydroorotase [Bdellovibrionales bacterium]
MATSSAVSVDRLTLRRPDDWHVHLRDGAMLRAVAPLTAAQFGRAVVMPNLNPPVTSAARAKAYREEILRAVPKGMNFQPLMTLYLTDDVDVADLEAGFREGVFTAAKLYPANATTNSAKGVTDVRKLYPALERMQKIGMPLLVHGEVTEAEVDVFDREKIFIEQVMEPLRKAFSGLKVVFEHVTTAEAVAYAREGHSAGGKLGATITAHHLFLNRTDIFRGGVRPHHYCLPIAKREKHRLALIEAATSGEAAFFLGTDSAPHPVKNKESSCGCAGVFTAATALELYAEAFDRAGALDRLEAFASLNGPRFYGLAVNEDTVTLVRADCPEPVPVVTETGDSVVTFVPPTGKVGWKMDKQSSS